MRTIARPIALAALAGLSLAMTTVAQQSRPLKIEQEGQDIIREGSGTRRDTLNKMELKPFPSDAWSKLADWTNGAAPTQTDLQGKVVLICTYKDWHPVSKKAMQAARRLAGEKAAQGLVVIAVHDQEAWDEAEKLAAPANATFLLAHDAKGDFRKALHSDADPDFYVIDRAGQMRYADIATESVDSAVTSLLAEQADAAASTQDRLKADAEAKARADARTAALQGLVQFKNLPELPWTRPDKEEYDKAKWPRLPRDQSLDINSEAQPKPISLPDTDWFPTKPETNGRVILFYFFHPYMLRGMAEAMHDIDIWQRQLGRDVVIVGVITNFDSFDGYTIPDKEKTPEYLRTEMEKFGKSRNFDHFFVCDPNRALIDAIVGPNPGTVYLPFYALASSDNLVRWWSHENAPSFEGSLERIVKNDPGVKLRREAEDAWIKANTPSAMPADAPADAAPAPSGT